ncbi:tail protein [Porphyromonas phage phage007a_Bg4]|uniref:hypothetical protein n=1 Tax=Porphyromonas gingivalis TaxID=837 RepID=UPI0024810336|nr:hypothetical protein [Porphyromonas gingivalis]MDH7902950.1 hypothetical protein [Porphyromonas gingivalis]
MATLQVMGHGTRKLKPLSTSLSFRFEGGAPVQAVNAATGEHVPDWRFSPIRIVPIITVTDPEGLVTNGVHNNDTPTMNMRWLYDETGVNVLAGESPADISIDTSASDLRGALNIRRNFSAGTLLRFEYEFTTSAAGVLRTAKHSATVAITINQMADALVQVRTAYPRGQFVFFPSPDAPADLVMDMRLYHDGKPCPAAYRWYAVNKNGQETVIPGQNGPILTRPATTVQSIDHYRCKALDMRPEYASALEAALGRARADVYKKYLGDNWAAVLPTVRPNLYEGGDFIQDGGNRGVAIPEGVLSLPPSQRVGISFKIRFISEGSAAAAEFPNLKTRILTISWNPEDVGSDYILCPYPRDPSVATRIAGFMTRLSNNPNAKKYYFFYPQNGYAIGPRAVKAAFTDIKIEIIKEDGLPDTTPYLPHADKLSAEIRARAAEIVASNPPPPPAVWPLARTYTRDFSLKVHTVPYELILRVEGLGEEVIVRNGSLARGSGAAQQLFSNVPRSMTRLRSSVICRQGRHTYSAEETARMFDVQWPASAINISGCTATMTDLSFAISINTKY